MTQQRTREQLLEAAVRVLLRRLGGDVSISDCDMDEVASEPLEVGGGLGLLRLRLPMFLAPADAFYILSSVDDGTDIIVESSGWGWAGDCIYRTSAGHRVVIFNDCGSWDYVSEVHHADGRVWRYGDDDGPEQTLFSDWMPKNFERWGIRETSFGRLDPLELPEDET